MLKTKLGLIGYPLGHSFSKKYYLKKFEDQQIKGIDYDLYPIRDIQQFSDLYHQQEGFYGFNVTIPYKISVIPFLDELSPEARDIQAVNCIQVRKNGDQFYLKGYNTDVFGFMESLKPLLTEHHHQALILGNGGAAKAVMYALKALHIPFKLVSRSKSPEHFTYDELSEDIIRAYPLIINCSPVGTFPNVDEKPLIPYSGIGDHHVLYDLIYNPEETAFLKEGKKHGAQIKNGLEMLVLQAEKNWEIWNS